jgi:hypothetical protein
MQRWAELSGFNGSVGPFGALKLPERQSLTTKTPGMGRNYQPADASGLWRLPLFQWARETLRLLVCTKTPIAMAERAVGLLQAGIVI